MPRSKSHIACVIEALKPPSSPSRDHSRTLELPPVPHQRDESIVEEDMCGGASARSAVTASSHSSGASARPATTPARTRLLNYPTSTTGSSDLYTMLARLAARLFVLGRGTFAWNFSALVKEMEAKQVVWTAPMTAFMLDHLCKVVADGVRTSTGFKKCQLAGCASAMNDHFQLKLTHANVGNHNRTWRRKWGTILRLRGLSGALWDDEKSMIVLDHEHYTNHIKDHKEDEPFLNKPLKHYNEMAILHGNTMATGQYTKGSNDPLATEVNDISDSEASPVEEGSKSSNGGDSVAPKPTRAKTKPSVDEGLQSTLMAVGERLAIAIESSVSTDNNSTNSSANSSMVGLWEGMKDLPLFGIDFLAHYFAYLVENPNIAMAFQLLEKDQKSIWVARYVKNTFPEMDG